MSAMHQIGASLVNPFLLTTVASSKVTKGAEKGRAAPPRRDVSKHG